MDEEYESITHYDIWEVVQRPQINSIISYKWLYKIKHGADGNIVKEKVRFVDSGFSQNEGIDYGKKKSFVACYTIIQSTIALATIQRWSLHQIDLKTAFLHGFLKEEVFVKQSQGYEVHDPKSHVCRLNKSLYGLNQALRSWYAHIDNFFMKLGFTRRNAYENLYFKIVQGMHFILILYVDDYL